MQSRRTLTLLDHLLEDAEEKLLGGAAQVAQFVSDEQLTNLKKGGHKISEHFSFVKIR